MLAGTLQRVVAAVAFAAVGLSADAGVATSAAYGMLAAVSALPGVLVMLLDLRTAAARTPATVGGTGSRVELSVPVRLDQLAGARS